MIAIHTQNRSGIRFSRTLLEKIKKTIRTAVEAEYPNHTFELNIFFCDDETIRSYNREYRGVDRATDVLSFPMFDFGTPELPALLGDDARQQRHEFLYWEFHETDQIGVRMGDWKLVVKSGKPRLYDLSRDLHEDCDLAGRYPEVVERMVGIVLREHAQRTVPGHTAGNINRAIPIQH